MADVIVNRGDGGIFALIIGGIALWLYLKNKKQSTISGPESCIKICSNCNTLSSNLSPVDSTEPVQDSGRYIVDNPSNVSNQTLVPTNLKYIQ